MRRDGVFELFPSEEYNVDVESKEMEKGTLFVTGGSSGIGEDVLKLLTSEYKNAFSFDVLESKEFDVRKPELLQEAFNKELIPGKQNDLVVSAGVFIPKDFLKQSKSEIDFVADINFKGALYTVQSFLNWHKKQKDTPKPNIILISSISSFFHGGRRNVVYDSTKAALSYVVKNLANYDCIVNVVEPGTIRETKIGGWTEEFEKDSGAKELIEKGQEADVKRMGEEVTKREVSRVVQMLLFENKTGAINGTAITVDGGLTSIKERF